MLERIFSSHFYRQLPTERYVCNVLETWKMLSVNPSFCGNHSATLLVVWSRLD